MDHRTNHKLKPKTVKFLEENTGKIFCDHGLGNYFLDTIPKNP